MSTHRVIHLEFTNLMRRVFKIKTPESSFTGFMMDVDGRQYLCTAKHCLPHANDNNFRHTIIFHDGEWKPLNAKFVGFGSKGTDICVLAPIIRLSQQPCPLPSSPPGIAYGQDVYFLGFPYGMGFDLGILMQPFVKKATVSAFHEQEQQVIFLDGHNNPGFSGAPVIFKENRGKQNSFHVAAVVSGFLPAKEPVVAGYEKGVMSIDMGDGKRKQMEVYLNTGIAISYGISHALDAIRENPIGVKLN